MSDMDERIERAAIVTYLESQADLHSRLAAEARDSNIEMAKSHKSIAHTCRHNARAIAAGAHLKGQETDSKVEG
jgi:hypothetical protein